MKAKSIFTLFIVVLIAVSVGIAAEMGAENIVLDGGSKGKVSFPHKDHQEDVKDCDACHKTFPQEEGSIAKLKTDGSLKAKQVMNTVCLKCHRADKKAGKEAGPTSCSGCHAK